MNNQVFSGQKKSQQRQGNFSQALAELEKKQYSNTTHNNGEGNPFADALAQTGGKLPDMNSTEQQAELEKQRKEQEKKAAKLKKHKEINPVETTKLFDNKEKQVKEEIDKLRNELKLLATDVAKFQKDVDLTLMTEVVEPGTQGSYYLNFFQKLRAFIMLLRQKVKSASTWLSQFNGKKKKKRKKSARSMEIGGNAHEKTDMVQKMMHHENNAIYGG